MSFPNATDLPEPFLTMAYDCDSFMNALRVAQ
jgi:hypothetical protein